LYRPAVQPKLPSSSLAVTPPSGHRPFGPPTCCSAPGRTAHRQPSWSFPPLRRFNLSESTVPRFASPGPFRPQGFSPSRRITPRPDVRPYFRPVAPLGFRSSGVYPHRQVPRTRRLTELPSWRLFLFSPNLGLRARGVCRRCLERAQTFFAFRALLQQWIRTAYRPRLELLCGRSPLELRSPLGFLPTSGATSRVMPSALALSSLSPPASLWASPPACASHGRVALRRLHLRTRCSAVSTGTSPSEVLRPSTSFSIWVATRPGPLHDGGPRFWGTRHRAP
jgi:hypothetical protein